MISDTVYVRNWSLNNLVFCTTVPITRACILFVCRELLRDFLTLCQAPNPHWMRTLAYFD